VGYSISWLAVRGKDRDSVLAELGLRSTGRFEDVPESPVVGASLQSGWYLVLYNQFGGTKYRPESLSLGCELMTCDVEEHVMCFHVQAWQNGVRRWQVAHDSQQPDGLFHLDAEGDLPSEFSGIRDARMAEQQTSEDCDYVAEIPLQLAKNITGFKHDDSFESAMDKPFEALETIAPASTWNLRGFLSAIGLGERGKQ